MDGKAASPLSGFGFTPSAARMAMAVPGSARYPLIVSCFYQVWEAVMGGEGRGEAEPADSSEIPRQAERDGPSRLNPSLPP